LKHAGQLVVGILGKEFCFDYFVHTFRPRGFFTWFFGFPRWSAT
jgi:hypothetical protein